MTSESTMWTIFLSIVGFCVAMAALREWTSPQRRARRLLRREAPRRLGDVADGVRARVDGFVRQRQGTKSLFTGRGCVGYLFAAEERGSEDWTEVHRQWHCEPFDIVADGGVARVEGPFVFGLPLDGEASSDVSDAMRAALHGALVDTTLPFGGPRPFRYREALLEDGHEVSVLGVVSSEPAPPGHEPRAARLRVIRGTQETPVVLTYRTRVDV